MKKIWLLAAGLIIGTPLRSSAEAVKAETPPKVEESSSDADKAALNAAASEADKWAATQKAEEAKKKKSEEAKEVDKVPPSPSPSVTPPPVQAEPPKPQPTETPKPVTQPRVARTGLNEMKGKVQSKGDDPRTLRVLVDGGFNVEFTYDGKTNLVNGGSAITMDDLEYNDEVIVRYAGKELYALEIDRISKAPRPQ